MAGTKEGGLKARDRNLAKNPNFYRDIGRKGGKNGHTGGFASYQVCTCDVLEGEHYKQQCAGAKGGAISRRPKRKPSTVPLGKNFR